jgi:hypothetical protein
MCSYDNMSSLVYNHPFTIYLDKNTKVYWDTYNGKPYNNYEPYIIINGE